MTIEEDDDLIPDGYARVTEILKPYVSFDGIPPDVLKKAADRGRRVHRYCELYNKNLLIERVDEECKPYVESYIQWKDSMVEEVWHNELRVSCPELRISGKFDMIATIRGDSSETLIDIKTPLQTSVSWQLQTAAYRYLVRVCEGIELNRRVCLMLDRNGNPPKVVEYTDHARDERMFLNAVELHYFFK